MEDTTLNNTMSGTSSVIKPKKTYDPKRRQVMLNILNQGTDPNELRRILVMHGYDEDEVNDAIDTYKRITNPQDEKPQQEQGTTATDYANAIRNKQITLNDVPEGGQDAVVRELSNLGPVETGGVEQQKYKQTQEQLAQKAPVLDQRAKDIDELKDDWYLDSAVGPNAAARTSMLDWATGGKQEFIGKVQQVIDQAAMDKLIEVKGEGATFGALSEQEQLMIKRASTPIWNWVQTDKDGNITGYDVGEKAFKEELDRLKEDTLRRKKLLPEGGQNKNQGTTSSGLKYIIE